APHGATLWQTHDGRVFQTLYEKSLQLKTVSLASSGQYLAVGDGENIQVFDKAGQPKHFLSGHTEMIIELIFTQNNTPLLLSASKDRTVRLWETEGFNQAEVFSEHTRPITSLALSVDEKTILTASLDGTVRVWDALTGRLQKTLTFGSSGITAMGIDT